MIKPVLNIIFTLLLQFLHSQQNLVPNHSFEDTLHCPNGTNDPGALSQWYNPSSASPDYYNSCANNGAGIPANDWGYQYPQDGKAYVGLVTYSADISNYREYLQVQLTEKLVEGKTYCWSFWSSLLDSTDYASNCLGLAFSKFPVTNFTSQSILNIACAGYEKEVNIDRNNWKQISGIYSSIGGEEFITIGNFFNDQGTQFSQIATNTIGGRGAYYYVDNISIGDCFSILNVPNIFTPNNDGINDNFELTIQGISDLTVVVSNRWGNTVYVGSGVISWDGKFEGADCSEGTYFFYLRYKNLQWNRYETKTGFVQLVR